MNPTNTRHLLHKFIKNECTPQETEAVVQYFREKNLTNDFPTVEDVKELLTQYEATDEASAERLFSGIMKKAALQNDNKKVRRMPVFRYAAVAATLLLLLGAGWMFINKNSESVTSAPYIDPNQITLQMADGSVQVIDEKGNITIKDADGNTIANKASNKLIYDANTTEELVYNTLRIPYGKRFDLQLSDGTKVHLNAGTTLRFPVKFLPGQNRQVFVDGEAFFDVAKDKDHPFTVNANQLDITVLGTQFNVSNYPEDDATDVVLVEGSVGLHTSGSGFDKTKDITLKPGFKASFSKAANTISRRQVKTDIYTAWINGELVFREMSFNKIAKKLERYYDIKIDNNNAALASQKFNARFKEEPVEKVLSYFSDIQHVTYTKKDNMITINP